MSLNDAVTAALPGLRAEAEALMVDTVRFTVPLSGGMFNPETGKYVWPHRRTIYWGRCQVQLPPAIPQNSSAGDQPLVVERVTIKIPVTAPEIPVGAIAKIVDVGDASDPGLIGTRFRVVGSHHKTFATARRLPCTRIEEGVE